LTPEEPKSVGFETDAFLKLIRLHKRLSHAPDRIRTGDLRLERRRVFGVGSRIAKAMRPKCDQEP